MTHRHFHFDAHQTTMMGTKRRHRVLLSFPQEKHYEQTMFEDYSAEDWSMWLDVQEIKELILLVGAKNLR